MIPISISGKLYETHWSYTTGFHISFRDNNAAHVWDVNTFRSKLPIGDNMSEEFLDADQIVDDIVKTTTFRDIGILREQLESPYVHRHIGEWIRNQYKLWYPDNPHTMQRHVPVIINHCDTSEYHPDNYSAVIIDKLKKRMSYAH